LHEPCYIELLPDGTTAEDLLVQPGHPEDPPVLILDRGRLLQDHSFTSCGISMVQLAYEKMRISFLSCLFSPFYF
jgi:hypothetical protein